MFSYISALPSAAWEQARPRTLALLGSTGSVGVSALDVVEARPGFFRVLALAGGRNVQRLAEQAARLRPHWLGVQDSASADALRALLPTGYAPQVLVGQDGYAALASLPEVSTVLSAQVGAAGLRATVAAAESGKVIALANKESLILAGKLLRDLCARTGAVILPVDSEHNALFQAALGRAPAAIHSVTLTASGGPFRGKTAADLATVTAKEALRHPKWSMGPKISIDSATLMNKGLEVLEAHQLYGLPSDQIKVLVHPQSLVHGLVEFADGSQLAQLGVPDMRLPIAHCLAWPESAPCGVPFLDLARHGALTFEEPDLLSFPCLNLARRVMEQGGGSAVVLNAANEVAVDAFLAGRITFMEIPALIARALDDHNLHPPCAAPAPEPDSVAAIEALDLATRHTVGGWIELR